MGKDDALAQEDDPNEDGELEGSEDPEGEEGSKEPEGTEGPEDAEGEKSEEFEIVRETGAGSQPDKQHGIRTRINRLNDQKRQAEVTASQVTIDLENERRKNQLLQLALDQQKDQGAATPPDPDEFDDGVRDPKYITALKTFNQPAIDAAVKEHVTTIAAEQPKPVDPGIERAQRKHYERADKLGARDFDETEDKAIAILGNNVVNHIILNSEKSEQILYYLGKNPGEAEDIRSLIDSNSVKGVLQIGRLEAQLSVKPKAKAKSAPNPDEDLSGGSPSKGKRGPKGATYT